LNGEKMWITNGLSARWFLTLARLEGSPPREGLCALMVDGRQEGLERTKIRGKMGIRGSETAVISFHDVFVPAEHLLGNEGDGLRVFLTTLNRGRIGIACQATGIAEACLEAMVAYARERKQFDRPIGRFPAVADMIADSAVELEASKLLIWRAACRAQEGELQRASSSMAKAYATEAANRIAYRAVQVHGGTGYVRESRVEQLYRDARVTTIYEGTSEIQRAVIARELGDEE
ncbi:MAG: acyl-CoA dehydrogenase, partial [Planctomycetota bacterium]